MGKTVTLTLLAEDAEKLRNLLDAALQPAESADQRLSVESMVEIFKGLAYSGKEFNVVFVKLDGTLREMRAECTDVRFNYGKRESFANVIDLDLAEQLTLETRFGKPAEESEAARKIVINRVKVLTTTYRGEVFTFRPIM